MDTIGSWAWACAQCLAGEKVDRPGDKKRLFMSGATLTQEGWACYVTADMMAATDWKIWVPAVESPKGMTQIRYSNKKRY